MQFLAYLPANPESLTIRKLAWKILNATYCHAYILAISYGTDFEFHKGITVHDTLCFAF